MLLSWFSRTNDVIARDAARLMEQMGDQAFSVAGELSWREDAGSIVVKRPGHWRVVQAEFGRQTGESLPVRHFHPERQRSEGRFLVEIDRVVDPVVCCPAPTL